MEWTNHKLNMWTVNTDYDNKYYECLNTLLLHYELGEKREKWSHYVFNGVNVPRTTEIINNTINKEYLNNWAAKLGPNYKRELDMILDTGSMVHAMIEDFITIGRIREAYPEFKYADPLKAMRAYHNFRNFWQNMHTRGFKIEPIAIELPFSTPWYGGTIDFIAKIIDENGVEKIFILDFKTSGKISYNYFLQLEMYWQAMTFIVSNYDICNIKATQPHYTKELVDQLRLISGIGIIRVDKQRDTYEYILADLDTDLSFLSRLDQAASSMVNWYYQMQYMDLWYGNFRREYVGRGGISGIYNRSDISEQ